MPGKSSPSFFFLKRKSLEPRKCELLATSNLCSIFAMTKFFHSTWPHVILTEPEGQMFSCFSHGEVGGLRDIRWADQGHTVWRAQLYSLPRALSTWGWQTLVPGIDSDLSVLSSPWAMTQPSSLFCVAKLTLDHILPQGVRTQSQEGNNGGRAISDKRLFWPSGNLWVSGEAGEGKLEKTCLGKPRSNPDTYKMLWKIFLTRQPCCFSRFWFWVYKRKTFSNVTRWGFFLRDII